MHNLRTKLTLRPGQRGTKKLLKQFGDRLVCVRYRYDETSGKRLKTAEIIIDEPGWDTGDRDIPSNERRYVVVHPHELRIREKVKAAGGRWHPHKVAWSLPHDRIVSLGLTDRMLAEPYKPDKRQPHQIEDQSHYM